MHFSKILSKFHLISILSFSEHFFGDILVDNFSFIQSFLSGLLQQFLFIVINVTIFSLWKDTKVRIRFIPSVIVYLH